MDILVNWKCSKKRVVLPAPIGLPGPPRPATGRFAGNTTKGSIPRFIEEQKLRKYYKLGLILSGSFLLQASCSSMFNSQTMSQLVPNLILSAVSAVVPALITALLGTLTQTTTTTAA